MVCLCVSVCFFCQALRIHLNSEFEAKLLTAAHLKGNFCSISAPIETPRFDEMQKGIRAAFLSQWRYSSTHMARK